MWDPPSIPWNWYRNSLVVLYWPEHQAQHAFKFSDKAKNAWNYTSSPSYVFMLGCSVKYSEYFGSYRTHVHKRHITNTVTNTSRSQWPRGLRRRSAAAHLLRLWVRIPPGAWMFVCCECCVLSGRGLCDELITRPEESYRLWCVVVCDLETSTLRRPWPALGRRATGKKKLLIPNHTITKLNITNEYIF